MGEMDAKTRVRNPRGSGERLRDEILRAAIDLLDQTNDASSLTLRGIARHAGISAPSIYGHFADLASLTDALLERSFGELTNTVQAAMDATPEPAEQLLAAGRAYVQFGWDHQARYRLMFAATGYAQNAIDTFALVTDAIQRCVDAGVSASANPPADTWMLWAALHGVATLDKPGRADQLKLGPLDRPAMLEIIIRRLARLPE